RPAGHRGGALLGQPGLRLRASAHVHLRYMVVALGASHRRRRSPGPCPDRATCRRYLTAGVSMQLTTRPEGPLMSNRMVAMGLFLGVLGVNFMAGADELFKAQLTGDQEVPAVATDTTGRFEILVNKDATAGEYTLRVDSGVRITQSHFHCGAAGVNGPIIVFLAGFRAEGWDGDGKGVSNATITGANVINTACGTALAGVFQQARVGNVCVNVHSVAHPGGVARGQLEPADAK